MIGTERLFVLVWILELRFLEKSTKTLSNFQARKICHAGPFQAIKFTRSSEDKLLGPGGTGLMLLQLDSRDEWGFLNIPQGERNH